MTLNTTAPLFSDNRFEQEMKQQEAELYARLYPMAAEDFTSFPDVQNFATGVITALTDMQKQLTSLMSILASHTHTVPPHTHPLEPHTHICAPPNYPSGPNLGGFATLPTPLVSDVPVQGGNMNWNVLASPTFSNSTGAIPNMDGNMVTVGPSRVGPLITGPRRLKEDPNLHAITLLPIVKSLKAF